MSILKDLTFRIISISPDFFPKSFNKFAGLKQPEPPEKIYPISVASEQGLDASALASIQTAATKATDIGYIFSGGSSVYSPGKFLFSMQDSDRVEQAQYRYSCISKYRNPHICESKQTHNHNDNLDCKSKYNVLP